MQTIEINGKPYTTDEEGYLHNWQDWDLEFAKGMAKKDDCELTDEHILIIELLREYYEEYKICPAMRMLNKAVGKKLGLEKGNSKYLYELFTHGPARQACKYAGVPKPTGCV